MDGKIKKEIESLLLQVMQINKKYEEFYKQTGKDFNVFMAIERELDERIHQNFIVNLLKYDKKFLKEFVNELSLKNFKWDFKNIKIEKEVVTHTNKRIDIVIKDNKNCIGIEMKTITTDHDCQLEDYYNYLNSKCKNFKLFYLTLIGEEATEECAQDKYIPISFFVIYNWIKKCIEISSDIPYLREVLIQYKNLLENILNLDYKKEKEMIELIDNMDKIKAAYEIYSNYGNIWKDKIYDFYGDVWDKVYETYAKKNGWRDASVNEFNFNNIWCKDEDCNEYKDKIDVINQMDIKNFGVAFAKDLDKEKSICVSIENWHENVNFYVWISYEDEDLCNEKCLKILNLNKVNGYGYKNANIKFFYNNPTFELFDKVEYKNIVKKISDAMIELLKIVDSKLEEIKKVV